MYKAMTEPRDPKTTDPGPWCTFLFAATMWLFSFGTAGLLKGDLELLYGMMLSVSLPFWFIAGNMYCRSGDLLNGHMYRGLGILFGGFMGVAYLAVGTGKLLAVELIDEHILGVLGLIGGLYMTPAMPKFLAMDKANCVTWLTLAIWLYCGSFACCFPENGVLAALDTFCCFVLTASSTWVMVNEVCVLCYGKGVPMGRPWTGNNAA